MSLRKTTDISNTSEFITGDYLRDDRPFGGGTPPALYHFSTVRRMEHPTRHLAGWTGILQADAYGWLQRPLSVSESGP